MNTIKNIILIALTVLSLNAQDFSPIYDFAYRKEEAQYHFYSRRLIFYRKEQWTKGRFEQDARQILTVFYPSFMIREDTIDCCVSVDRSSYYYESLSIQYDLRCFGTCDATVGFDLVSEGPWQVEYSLNWVPLEYDGLGRISGDWANEFGYDNSMVITGPTGVSWNVLQRHRLTSIEFNVSDQ